MKVLHFYRTYYPDSFGGVAQVIRQMVGRSARQSAASEVLVRTRDIDLLQLMCEGRKDHFVSSLNSADVLRAQCVAKGLARVPALSWQCTAEQTAVV